MAFNILAMNGFDNYATADLGKFFNLSQQGTIDTTNTPFGTGRSVVFANVASWRTLAVPTTKLAMTAYFKTTTLTGVPFFFRLYDNITAQTTILVDGSGFIKIVRGDTNGTVLATSASQYVLVNGWYHIEAKFTCTTNSSANDCQVWINGVLAVSLGGSLSTRNTSNTQYTSYWVGNTATTTYVDDLSVYDWSSGDVPPMGQCRICNLSPDGNGNGSVNNFVGSDSDSTNNYLLTNNIPINTATYTGSANHGDLDLYTMSNLPTTPSTIIAVQVSSIAAKTDSSQVPGRNILKSGGVNYSGSEMILSPSYQQFSDIYTTDPNTSAAWVYTNINALEAGVTIQSIFMDTVSGGILAGSTALVGGITNATGAGGVLCAGSSESLPVGYTGWWSAGSGYFTDAGSTPATNNNDLVYQWNNQTPGATIHMLQATSGNRPLLKTNSLAGFAGLQFNGTSQFLTVPSGFDSTTWPCTLIIVGNWNGTQTDGNPRIAGYGQNQSFYRNGSHNWGVYAVPGIQDLGHTADAPAIAILRCDATGARQYRFNGAAPGPTFQFSGTAGNRLALGCHGSDGGELASCIVYEVIHYPYLITDVEAAQIETYLNGKFSIY